MKTIDLTRGYVALVDDDDFESLSKYRWQVRLSKRQRQIYAVRYASGNRKVFMHKDLCGGGRVDHIDGDGLNNQRGNLRPASASQNQCNSPGQARRRSRFKGVGMRQRKNGVAWMAQIAANGKQYFLGYFRTEREAGLAYNESARKLHGDFAWFNPVFENVHA